MGVRLFWCPLIPDPETGDQTPKIAVLLAGKRRPHWYCESKGGPVNGHVFCAAFAEDLTVVNLDATIVPLTAEMFVGDRRDVRERMRDCWSVIREWAKTWTFNDLPVEIQANWSLVLTSLGVPSERVQAGTSMYEVLRAILEKTAPNDVRGHLGERP